MISWHAWDKATISGHIVYLYRITFKGQVEDSVIAYASGRETKTFDGTEFLPHPCVHEEIKEDEIGAITTIKVPAAVMWIETCLKHNPSLTLEIFRWREEKQTAHLLFFGTHKQTTFADTDILIDFGNPLAASNVKLITYYTQRFCNHDMYGQFCGLRFDDFVQEFSGYEVLDHRRIRVEGASFDPDYWKSGLFFYSILISDNTYTFTIEQSNMIRNIENEDTLVVKYPLSNHLNTGRPIHIAPNCILDLDRCAKFFSNAQRATAWPDMPRSNYTTVDVTQIGEGNQGNIGVPRELAGPSPFSPAGEAEGDL